MSTRRWRVCLPQGSRNRVQLTHLAYRLYTVIPRLLDLVADLTNWYIRFNRTRLKGAGGLEDTRAALNTLYETLRTLCLTMVRDMIQQSWAAHLLLPVLFHPFHQRDGLSKSPRNVTSIEDSRPGHPLRSFPSFPFCPRRRLRSGDRATSTTSQGGHRPWPVHQG